MNKNKLLLRKSLLIILMLFILGGNSFALPIVSGLVNGISNKYKAAKDAAYQAFMKIKIVEQIRVLKQNYQEGVEIKNGIKKLSEHKGGIVGYAKDDIINNIDTINKETVWDFEAYMDSQKEDTSYVNTFLEKLDKKIERKISYSKKMQEQSRKRDERLKHLTILASKDTLTNAEKERFERSKALLELEYLSTLSKQSQFGYNDKLDSEVQDYVEERKLALKRLKYLKELEKTKSRESMKQQKRRKRINKIMKELPK